jgi:hypothetical protein
MTVTNMLQSCAKLLRPDSAAAFDIPYTPDGVKMLLSLNGARPSLVLPCTRTELTKIN